MEAFEVNGKPALKILARQILQKDKAILFDCEGDEVWLPKSCVSIENSEIILIQEWLYKQKFES